jgi:hypothetical protein
MEGKLSLPHVARWDLAPMPNRNSVVFRLHYSDGAGEQSQKERKCVLTAAQAEALRDELDSVLRGLDAQQERSVKESAPS